MSYALNERPTYDLVDEMLKNALDKLMQSNADNNLNDKPIIHSEAYTTNSIITNKHSKSRAWFKACQERAIALIMQ